MNYCWRHWLNTFGKCFNICGIYWCFMSTNNFQSEYELNVARMWLQCNLNVTPKPCIYLMNVSWIFWSKQIYFGQKILDQKNLWDQQKFWGLKKFLGKIFFGQINFRLINFWAKKFFVRKILKSKFFGPKNLLGINKILG